MEDQKIDTEENSRVRHRYLNSCTIAGHMATIIKMAREEAGAKAGELTPDDLKDMMRRYDVHISEAMALRLAEMLKEKTITAYAKHRN